MDLVLYMIMSFIACICGERMTAPVKGQADESSRHAVHSTLRERIIEHLFIGHALQWFWKGSPDGVLGCHL